MLFDRQAGEQQNKPEENYAKAKHKGAEKEILSGKIKEIGNKCAEEDKQRGCPYRFPLNKEQQYEQQKPGQAVGTVLNKPL